MRFMALVLALLLAACGGGGGSGGGPVVGPPKSGVVYVVTVESFPDARLGEYDDEGGVGYVRVLAAILANPVLAQRTVMHEVGHAAGLPHTPGNGCVMDQTAYASAVLFPCGSEVAGLKGTLQVYVGLAPGLLQATGNAASAWNIPAGRTVFNVN